MLILGVKDSSMLNIIFTGANLAIVVFIVIVGTIESDPGNWFLDVYVWRLIDRFTIKIQYRNKYSIFFY
jgi:hypothetical protein